VLNSGCKSRHRKATQETHSQTGKSLRSTQVLPLSIYPW
jgi:hypothetical protein